MGLLLLAGRDQRFDFKATLFARRSVTRTQDDDDEARLSTMTA